MIKHLCTCLAALFCWAAQPAIAEVTLSPTEAKKAAENLLSSGQIATAVEILTVLVRRDPNDVKSLILLSHAHRKLADYPEAKSAARSAWNTATTDETKYFAAIAMAQALSSGGNRSMAQIWLRRAAHVAPSQAHRVKAAKDFQYVKSRNPLSLNLSFGMAPSNNVNGAPIDNTFVLGGLVFVNPSAVPISGITFSSAISARHSFNIQDNQRDHFRLDWAQSDVVFTESSLPVGISEGDFNYRQLQAGWGRELVNPENGSRQSIGLSGTRFWYAGEHLSDEISLSYGRVTPKEDHRVFNWGASLGYTSRIDNADRSGVTGTANFGWHLPRKSGASLGFDTQLKRVKTNSNALNHAQLKAGLNYTLAKPVLNARTQVGLSGSFRLDDTPVYQSDARTDLGVTLSTTFFFQDFDIYGFAPKISVNANRTFSNVTRFDTQSLGFNIGVQSVF